MKVVLATARYYPFGGGVETHTREMAKRLQARGVGVEIVTTDAAADGLPSVDWVDGLRVTRVRAFPRGHDIYWAPGLAAALRSTDWDLLHCQGIHTLVAPLAMMAARVWRKPYVVTFHTGGHSSRLRHRLRSIQWLTLVPLLKQAAALIAVSDFEKQLFAGLPRMSSVGIEVIPNGADPLGVPGRVEVDRTLVLSVGRLERYKGHQRAIAAIAELKAGNRDARLRIVGTGPFENELLRTAARLGVGDRVVIEQIDPNDRAAMGALLASAGAVVLLSEYEAHPIAVMEALAMGRPVIVSDVAGSQDLVRAGLVTPVSKDAAPGTIARAIEDALEQPTRPGSALPTWDEATDRLLTVYSRATAGAKHQ